MDKREVEKFLSAVQLSIDLPINRWLLSESCLYVYVSASNAEEFKRDLRFRAFLKFVEATLSSVEVKGGKLVTCVQIPTAQIGPRSTNFLFLTRLDEKNIRAFLGDDVFHCCAKEYLQFYKELKDKS